MNSEKMAEESRSYLTRFLVVFKWFGLPLIVAYLIFCYIDMIDLPPEIHFSFKDHVKKAGYSFEEHYVATEDGYILSLYRILGKKKPRKSPVLLVHGLSNSAYSFILNQCTKAPAFVLADNGYDVWLANLRGNFLSRGHKWMNATVDEAYWDFTFQDIILHDLPTFISFIKNTTNAEKVSVLGHSQGAAAVLWMLAYTPEMSKHVNLGVLIATPGGIINTESIYIWLLANPIYHELCRLAGINVISDWSDDLFFAKFINSFPNFSSFLASDLYDIELSGETIDHLGIYAHKMRGGTSLKNLLFWKQVKDNYLVHPKLYDYGKEGNVEEYGTEEPPVVNFQNIRTNIAVFNGKYDKAVPEIDSQTLKESLNQEYLVHYNDKYNQDHGGFIFGCDLSYFKEVLELLDKYK